MDPLPFSPEVLSMTLMLLLMLLDVNNALAAASAGISEEEVDGDIVLAWDWSGSTVQSMNQVMQMALNNSRMWNTLAFLDEDLGFWVKPRSTVWYSRFVVEKFDNARWVEMFRLTKRAVFSLAQLLSPTIQKKDTKYQRAIPVTVRLACTLFKLSHGASLLICSEMFAVGRSTVSLMLWEVVTAINVSLRSEILWPSRDQAVTTARDFELMCGLPGIMGAIDCTHIGISKPQNGAVDYYYFKSGGYSMNCQAVVDSNKRFLDVYVGMPGSTNDARMLRRSTLFTRGQNNNLWENGLQFHGFSPYLIGDAAYLVLPWLLTPHRRQPGLPVADALFNRKLSKARAVVENAFGLLKTTFRELLLNCDLHVCFVPDVVICCMLLHNLLLKQSHGEVERLLKIIRLEEQQGVVLDGTESAEPVPDVVGDDVLTVQGLEKRRDLGVFLALRRIVPL